MKTLAILFIMTMARFACGQTNSSAAPNLAPGLDTNLTAKIRAEWQAMVAAKTNTATGASTVVIPDGSTLFPHPPIFTNIIPANYTNLPDATWLECLEYSDDRGRTWKHWKRWHKLDTNNTLFVDTNAPPYRLYLLIYAPARYDK